MLDAHQERKFSFVVYDACLMKKSYACITGVTLMLPLYTKP